MFYSPSDHPYLLVRKKLTARDLFRKRLEELGLPLVEHRGMDLVFVAKLGDGYSVDQMASQDSHFLIRRILITGLGHDEKLLSNDRLFEKAVSPILLGAKPPHQPTLA